MKATVMITLKPARTRWCLEKALNQTDLGLTPSFHHLVATGSPLDAGQDAVYLVELNQVATLGTWLDSVPELCHSWKLLS